MPAALRIVDVFMNLLLHSPGIIFGGLSKAKEPIQTVLNLFASAFTIEMNLEPNRSRNFTPFSMPSHRARLTHLRDFLGIGFLATTLRLLTGFQGVSSGR